MPLTGKTTVYGVIGDPVAHTLSPLMHNHALGIMGLDCVYVPFHVVPERLGDAVRGMRAFGIRGLNVTVPHKTAVMQYLDDISPEARVIGAVNTILVEGGRLRGDNTDVFGFLMCVLKGGHLENLPSKVCVLGAGGAARGVVYACANRDEVEEVVVANRTVSKAETLAGEIAGSSGKRIVAVPNEGNAFNDAVSGAGLVVNTTSVGMHPDTSSTPVPDLTLFHHGQIVCDIIYSPLETRLLREAASRGASTLNGLAMLAYQGARSLSLWTGKEAPADAMLEILQQALKVGGE